MSANRAIEHTVLVAYKVETNLGGHRPQIVSATVLDGGTAEVYDEGTFKHHLTIVDNRVIRTKRWFARNLPKF